MDIGVFIPIANNGWLISKTSPQYMPSFELNKAIVEKAETYGFDFALSMVKLHGFGGPTEFWDHALESFTLMAGLAAVTKTIRLYASTAVLTLPPAIVARMATTIDSIAPGRFGINIVSGWHQAEYSQMGIWPGDKYFGYRYQYSTEYVRVMKDLWETGRSNFKGEHFQMDDCQLGPLPSASIKIVSAGQSDNGMEFVAKYCDFNFINGMGLNTPKKHASTIERLVKAAEATGRDVGSYVLCMVIADDTDDAAMARWENYKENADHEAIGWMADQGNADKTASSQSISKTQSLPEGAINFNMGTFVGSYAHVAAMLDEVASIPGTKGIMLTFDDFLTGLDQFGKKIQPLMACR
jgi:pyrimidine oxygenase